MGALHSKGWSVALVALVLSCGGDEAATGDEAAAAGGEASSGGEGATGVAGEISGPEGSVLPTELAEGQGASAADTPPGAQGRGGEAGTQKAGENPWGTADAEAGEPLPPRRPMNGGARTAYRQGLEASAAGNADQARAAFEQALSADANAFKAAYNLGVLADRAGQESRALDYYRRSLRAQADYERAAEGVVHIYLRRRNVQEALAFIEPLARRWQRNLHLQALYSEVLTEADRLEDAVNAARAALRRDERFVPAMIAIIKASLKQGRNELAQSVLEQALAVDDRNAELHFLKGRLYLAEEGRLRDALTEFRRAVELRPDYAEARMALGVQLLVGANHQEAVQQFEAAARLSPTQAAVHLNLGDAYRATKQWQRAKQSLDQALRLQSQLPEAHYNLGLMYLAAGAEFPGLDLLGALQKATEELTAYRAGMGARLRRDDPSQAYLEDITRQVEREKRRIEREQARAKRDAERAARQSAGGQDGGASTGGGSQ